MKSLFKNCPNGCKSILAQSNLSVSEGVLKECPDCGQLLSACSREHYEQSNQDWNTEEGTWPSDKDYKRLFKRRSKDAGAIVKILAKNKSDIRILDVGCSNGSGEFIANQLGLQAEGVDPSEKATKDGQSKGLKLHTGFLSDVAFDRHSFDAITLYEVIEHVAEPIALLNECARILRPGGVLLIGTGNIDSWTRHFRKNNWDFFDMHHHGGHINFFSPKSLKQLASQTGFSVVKVETHHVKFYEKNELSHFLYRVTKLFTELLNLPASLVGKGHQMEVFMRTAACSPVEGHRGPFKNIDRVIKTHS